MKPSIRLFLNAALLTGISASFPAPARASNVNADESLIFFPTLAYRSDDDGLWVARVQGWIFEAEADSRWRNASWAMFRRFLGLTPDQAETLLFQQRARPFLVDNERGKRVSIRIGASIYELEPSTADGHFVGQVRLDPRDVSRLARGGWLRYTAVTDPRDERVFTGEVQLLDATGVSVISDIDDTIKVSEVTNRKKLVENTFLLPFREVTGMAELYRGWSSHGVAFHFVSASPWQLYESLADFARDAGFPEATYHLRRTRLKDSSVWSLLADPLEAKLQVIESLMATYPHRRFILVGDSGERDPEVYGKLAEKRPEQVVRIYLRDVTGQAADSPRYRAAFGDLPADKWQVFQEPSTIRSPF